MRDFRCYYKLFILMTILSSALVSCSKEEKAEVSISYTLTMSPDLLKFVTPQVIYVDENGVLDTITGVEELDRKVIENSVEVGNLSAWSSVEIVGTGYKCWTIRMKFYHLDFHSYMSVKYLRNDFTEDTAGKIYDFHHDINTSAESVKIDDSGIYGDQDSYASASLLNYYYGDDIEKYLVDLTNNPDKVGFYVDENGKLTRKGDF